MVSQHRTEDFEFILDGVLGILAEHTAVNQNVLPGSKKPVDYILEICTSTLGRCMERLCADLSYSPQLCSSGNCLI